LDNREQFPPFAMAIQRDGEVMSYLPSEEFQSEKEAFVGTIRSLIPLARGRTITAAVLVTSMPGAAEGEESSIMFDLEQADLPRKLARLPYRSSQTGIEYGQMTFRDAKAKLFAS
jgi:hypothetical protein